jgi:hypothetical protein
LEFLADEKLVEKDFSYYEDIAYTQMAVGNYEKSIGLFNKA